MCFPSRAIHPTMYDNGSSKATVYPFVSLHVTKVTKTLWIRSKNVRCPRVLTNWSSLKDHRFRSKGARGMCFASRVIHPTRYHQGLSKVTICPFVSLHVTKVTKTLWIRSKNVRYPRAIRKWSDVWDLVTLSMVCCIHCMCIENCIIQQPHGILTLHLK
jgi:hypothetical protein